MPLIKDICKRCWRELDNSEKKRYPSSENSSWWDNSDDALWEDRSIVICRACELREGYDELYISSSPPKKCFKKFEYGVAAGMTKKDCQR